VLESPRHVLQEWVGNTQREWTPEGEPLTIEAVPRRVWVSIETILEYLARMPEPSETPEKPSHSDEIVLAMTEAIAEQSRTIAAQADQHVSLCKLNTELVKKAAA
jgi:hypothetical protein